MIIDTDMILEIHIWKCFKSNQSANKISCFAKKNNEKKNSYLYIVTDEVAVEGTANVFLKNFIITLILLLTVLFVIGSEKKVFLTEKIHFYNKRIRHLWHLRLASGLFVVRNVLNEKKERSPDNLSDPI